MDERIASFHPSRDGTVNFQVYGRSANFTIREATDLLLKLKTELYAAASEAVESQRQEVRRLAEAAQTAAKNRDEALAELRKLEERLS